MEAESPRRKGLSRAAIGVLLVVFAGWVVIAYTVIQRKSDADNRTRALSNMKQLSTMLFEFDSEYGNYPDDRTALDVKKATEKADWIMSGQFSNDYFRQLIAGGSGRSEKPFWFKTALSPKAPDDDLSTAAKALAAGEVSYSYIMASQTQGQSASGDPSRPVIVALSNQFRADWTFNPEPFAGMAIVLRVDNSATPMQMRKDNQKISTGQGAKTLGEVGEGTVWGTGMSPVLRAPQPR